MVLVCVSNLCSLLIRLYSTCTNLDKSIVTRCDNTDANKYIQTLEYEDGGNEQKTENKEDLGSARAVAAQGIEM